MIGGISAVIILAFIVVGAIGFLTGMYKGVFRSLVDLGFLALNTVLSIWISALISKNVIDVEFLSKWIPKLLSKFGSAQELIKQVQDTLAMPELATTSASLIISLVAVVVMPIVFMLVYLILGSILSIPKAIIKNLIFEKAHGTGTQLGGGAISAVVKVLALAVFLVPIIGYVNFANDTITKINSDKEVLKIGGAAGVIDQAADSAVSKTIYFAGGKSLFKSLTTVKVDGVTVSLTNETDNALNLYSEIKYFKDTDASQYGNEQLESIKRIEKIINEAELVPALMASGVSYVSSEWLDGKEVFGMEKPMLGEQLQGSFDSVLNTLSTTTEESFKADLCTVTEIARCAIEDGAIQEMKKENGNVIYVLESTDLISDVLVTMHKNERMRPILPALTNGIVNYLYSIYDEVNGTVTDKHQMIDVSTLSEEDVKHEGEVISSVIVELDVFLKSIDGKMGGEIIEILKYGDFAALGRAFNGIKKSYLFCDTYEFLLRMILESKGCAQLGILDDQFVVNAIKHDSDMEMMLVSRQKITLMVMSMHDGEDIEYNTAIEALLLNITSTDADSIKSIVTEENLKTLGIKGESAHTISGLLTSMVNSIKSEELQIPKEDMSKESESAGKVLTAINSALENSEKDKNVFSSDDGKESTSDMTASEFVTTTLESKLVSSMVIDATTDEEGNEVDDPYNVKEHLSENDITELEAVLGDEYASTQEGDEEKKATLDAIAHIFGVDASKFQ